MNKSIRSVFLFSVILMLGLGSCRPKLKIAETEGDVKPIKAKYENLIDSINMNLKNPESIAIKSKVYFKTPKMSDSFKMHFRVKKDSVIWISATYYKVEVARFLMTPDSVKMIDRRNSKYYKGDYRYIQNRFKVPFDFHILQSILLGNPFDLDSAVQVKTYSSRGKYIIASLSNQWYDDGSGEKQLKQQTSQIWIDPKTFRVTKSKVSEYKTKKHFTTTYSDTLMVDGFVVPDGAQYVLRDTDEMIFTAHYLKVELKKDMSFPFTISSKYEPIF